MDCTLVSVEQPSEQWHDLRRCRITASRLGDVMAGKKTKRYKQYQHEKIMELAGYKGVEETPEWFAHGKENEPKAIAGYEWKYGVDVEHNLFMIHKEYDWLGGSPDMIHKPDMDEGAEIKCRALYKNYRQHVQMARDFEGDVRAVPAADRFQVQGNMWLSGFDHWYYVNFYYGTDLDGGMQQKIHRVSIPRDQALIDKMEIRCLEFMNEVYEASVI